MAESPAATLRRAAEKMRGLARDAEPSPWRVELRDGDVDVLGPSPYWIGSFGHEMTAQAHHDGRYVAAMHPGVALAIAAWFETAGNLADLESEYDGGLEPSAVSVSAYAAALAFLGEA